MPASEPLPHFVDDLLGYLHETHPTHATLDGVHTHDDVLEDLSRHGIDQEARALAGYLRRLEEIALRRLARAQQAARARQGDGQKTELNQRFHGCGKIMKLRGKTNGESILGRIPARAIHEHASRARRGQSACPSCETGA